MSFRLLSKLVTLNDLERRNGPYFALLYRIFVYGVVAKQLLGTSVSKSTFKSVTILKRSAHYSAIIWEKRSDKSV